MERRLSAIMAVDVVGSSSLMEKDQAGTLAKIKTLRKEIVQPVVDRLKGRFVKLVGDGALLEFASVVNAVECALEVQKTLAASENTLAVRIGINLGDIIIDGNDIYGDGVNVASRLEAYAEPGGICISSIVKESLVNQVSEPFFDGGEQVFKNIERPIRVFCWPEKPGEHAGNTRRLSVPDKPSLVILPFDNLSNDPDQQYFSDGMVEAITAALAKVSSFFIIARNTAFTYKGKQFDIREVGRDLGVAYALEGSVQRSGNRVRITAQLIETENGAHVWAQRFDGTLDDIFELQDNITEQVAGALQPSIQLAEAERVVRKRPQEYGAYDHTMRALMSCWHLEKVETETAIGYLDKALAIDPDYPLALSLKAWCLAQRVVYNWTDEIAATKSEALRLGERAAGISGDDPLVLTVLGVVHSIVRNFGTGKILLDKAVAIDPNSSWAWSRRGWIAAYMDNPSEALQYFERSIRLSPFDPLTFNTYVGMASVLEMAERYEEAIVYYEKALQERPGAKWIYRSYCSALYANGNMEKAESAFKELMVAYPELTAVKVQEAMVFPTHFMDRMVANLKRLGLPD